MRIFGLQITREKSLSAVPTYRNGWRQIFESYTGAWQQNVVVQQADLTTYPTVFACLSRIATDIGKLPFCLKRLDAKTGVWKTITSTSYSPVLTKPNGYQTAQQFRESWILSKLTQGNAYVLKVRDNRNVVVGLYVLDPCRVQPMVTESGAVYYQLQTDRLNLLPEGYPLDKLLVPASEIIHDRTICLHHWLIGIPPICAAYWPAVKNLKILTSSAAFFNNNASPGGILTAPAGMSEEDSKALKDYWDANFTGENAGKVAVIGADMKFTSFAVKSADSQLVEQMKYSDEQICQPFGIPPFKVGIGSIPAGLGVDAINLLYYDDALSTHIEAMENLLDEALSLAPDLGIWMDTEPLLRMDVGKQADVEQKLVGGKIKTPDEARMRFNLGPTAGGDTIWAQQQDFPLGTLRDRLPPDQKPATPDPAPIDPAAADQTAKEFDQMKAELWQRKALEAMREAINARPC